MLRILMISMLFVIAAPAHAIYKCESGGKIIYGDRPCAAGKSTELDDRTHNSSSADIARVKQQNAEEKIKSKMLENARHKREAKDDEQQTKMMKAAAAQKKKCASLAQKKKWSSEDAANATGKKSETARRHARRAAEKYELECGK